MERLFIERIKDLDVLIGKNIICHDSKPKKLKNFNQVRLMFYLFNHQETPIYQKDLADELKLKKSSVTEHLDYLEKEGYVIRLADQKDKRKKEIRCSKKALNQMNKINDNLKKVNEKAIDGFSKNDLLIIDRLLKKIEINLRG